MKYATLSGSNKWISTKNIMTTSSTVWLLCRHKPQSWSTSRPTICQDWSKANQFTRRLLGRLPLPMSTPGTGCLQVHPKPLVHSMRKLLRNGKAFRPSSPGRLSHASTKSIYSWSVSGCWCKKCGLDSLLNYKSWRSEQLMQVIDFACTLMRKHRCSVELLQPGLIASIFPCATELAGIWLQLPNGVAYKLLTLKPKLRFV